MEKVIQNTGRKKSIKTGDKENNPYEFQTRKFEENPNSPDIPKDRC
jgi:hypothetical protein